MFLDLNAPSDSRGHPRTTKTDRKSKEKRRRAKKEETNRNNKRKTERLKTN